MDLKQNPEWIIYNITNTNDLLNFCLPSNFVKAIAIDNEGNIWVGADLGGLAKFDGVNWTVYDRLNSFTAIAIDKEGNVWVGTNEGLAKFDGVNWTVYNKSNSGLPSDDVRAIAIDKEGNIWVGTDKGLAKFDGVRWTVYKTWNSGLPSNHVTAIAIDNKGNIWIGTEPYENEDNDYIGGGLAKFDGASWTVYNTSNSGLPHDDVKAIAIDKAGNKWIGTDGGGLVKIEEKMKLK